MSRRQGGSDPQLDRREPGIDPHLDLKIGLFFLAAVLGLAGIILGRPLLIFAAMVVIGAGLLLRFLRPREGGARPGGASGGDGRDVAPGDDRPDVPGGGDASGSIGADASGEAGGGPPRGEDRPSAGDEAS